MRLVEEGRFPLGVLPAVPQLVNPMAASDVGVPAVLRPFRLKRWHRLDAFGARHQVSLLLAHFTWCVVARVALYDAVARSLVVVERAGPVHSGSLASGLWEGESRVETGGLSVELRWMLGAGYVQATFRTPRGMEGPRLRGRLECTLLGDRAHAAGVPAGTGAAYLSTARLACAGTLTVDGAAWAFDPGLDIAQAEEVQGFLPWRGTARRLVAVAPRSDSEALGDALHVVGIPGVAPEALGSGAIHGSQGVRPLQGLEVPPLSTQAGTGQRLQMPGADARFDLRLLAFRRLELASFPVRLRTRLRVGLLDGVVPGEGGRPRRLEGWLATSEDFLLSG